MHSDIKMEPVEVGGKEGQNRQTEGRAAKNSDFVRVIGVLNPPLRVRTDIYAINDLFGLWTRYKIGINLNYSDTSHFAHAHGTS